MKTTPLQHEIDGLTVENDLDGLIEMLLEHERDDDDVRYVIYAAIDEVSAHLESPIEVDAYEL